jgi:hypothetical protein
MKISEIQEEIYLEINLSIKDSDSKWAILEVLIITIRLVELLISFLITKILLTK